MRHAFFNTAVMAKYLPDIVAGFWLTVLLALCVVVTGIAAGLVLAVIRSLGIRPLNWLLIFVVDLFRALPPLVIIVLIYFGLPQTGFSPSAFGTTWACLPRADGLRRGDLLGRHHRRARVASGKRRAPPASLTNRRYYTWCCRRRCG